MTQKNSVNFSCPQTTEKFSTLPEDKNDIRTKISTAAKSKGITMDDIALHLNISRQALYQKYRGKHINSHEQLLTYDKKKHLQKIATLLEVDVTYFLSSTPPLVAEPLPEYHRTNELDNCLNEKKHLRKQVQLLEEQNQQLKELVSLLKKQLEKSK